MRRELGAADLIEIERGFEDGGITGGDGRYGLETLIGFIDHRHADGQGVILDGYSDSAAERLYGLAGYFLVSSGRDALADGSGGTPGDWWSGLRRRPRHARSTAATATASGVWRRDFANGVALLNEPGAPTRTVSAAGRPARPRRATPRSLGDARPGDGAVLLR